MGISPEDPFWAAPKTGHEWRDDNVLLATAWLSEMADRRTWKRRIDATRHRFLTAKALWAKGEPTTFYDPQDTVAWYIFQANAYADNRMNWVPAEAVRMTHAAARRESGRPSGPHAIEPGISESGWFSLNGL